MKLTRVVLLALFLTGCTGMSEDWGVGFVRGVRSLPTREFTAGEKKEAMAAKERFEKPFTEELRRQLAENDLLGLKGWLVFFDFFSDGTIKTANVWVYTYWGSEQRYNVYSTPIESFMDEAQLPTIVEESTQEVTSLLLEKAAFMYQQSVD